MAKIFDIKNYIKELLQKSFCEIGMPDIDPDIKYSSRPEIADFQSNIAFSVAKQLNKNPFEFGTEVVKHFCDNNNFVSAELVAPAFINFKITDSGYAQIIKSLYKNEFSENIGKGKTVVIDYGGANVAKELHMGHLRSPIIGECIKRLYKLFGYDTISDVHLGDWGLQMGLVMAILDDQNQLDYFYGKSDKKPVVTLDYLNEYYPKASARSKVDEEFKKKAESYTLKLQKKEEPVYSIWKEIRNVSVASTKRSYEELNCTFDLWYGESDAEPYIEKTVNTFIDKGLTKESEGALIVEVKKEGEHIPLPLKPGETKQLYKNPMPPMILKKHNGGDLYATTDIATIMQRYNDNKKLSAIVYTTDKRQAIHFTQVFRACRLAKIVPDKIDLIHIGFGTMNGKDGKAFKTREGGTIKLNDIIGMLKEKASAKLEQNGIKDNPKLALQIGVSAMKFGDLSNETTKDYIFDLDKFLSFEGRTGPYIQYTAVRIKSLLNKNGEFKENFEVFDPQQKTITNNIIKLRDSYYSAFTNHSPSFICFAVYNLASSFSTFYNNTRILTEKDVNKKNSYLTLSSLVYKEICKALDLLAIDVPDKM